MKHGKIKLLLLSLIICAALLPGCGLFSSTPESASVASAPEASSVGSEDSERLADEEVLAQAGEWQGKPFVYINENKPQFKDDEILDRAAERLDRLDELGRCGTATACIGLEGMPEGERGSIGMIRPTGWQISKYDFIDGKYLYNRCHLIGWQLSGDDAVERNLITGTRYMNTEGMLPFENEIAGYVRDTGNHVMYRVDPIFKGEDMLARGVHLEALSVEDDGRGVSFNVFCYNVQPDVSIDYADGANHLSETEEAQEAEKEDGEAQEYILNRNTKVFHYQNCKSVLDMKNKNKREVTDTRGSLIKKGYKPCGNCNP